MSGDSISTRSVGGLLAYIEWLGEMGYQGKGAIKAWRIAVKKVFETLDPEAYAAISLDGLDLDEEISRFRRLTESTYKAETIDVYASRIRRAIEAQQYYIDNNKPPAFKQGTSRPKQDDESSKKAPSRTQQPMNSAEPEKLRELPAPPDFFELNYPLSPGRMVYMRLPMQMSKREIDRLCAVLQTLEEQRQLPPGEAEAA